MAQILPFRAVRPLDTKVDQIVSNSYERYTKEELTTILDTNPYSFLQIITAGNPKVKTLTTKQRFEWIRKTYKIFRKQKYYQQEQIPSYYVYRTQNTQGVFTGIIARTSTQDYKNNIIKKHEQIISSRKKQFAQYLQHVGFNADPVLLTYPDNAKIATILDTVLKTAPIYDFETAPDEHHQLWVINNSKTVYTLTKTFETIPQLYIADGHHRCASSYELAQMMQQNIGETAPKNNYNYFMSYLLPESQLKIHAFNRLITDLNQNTPTQILSKISENYIIEDFGTQNHVPLHNNKQFVMCLENTLYRLSLKTQVATFTDTLSQLAPQILNTTILQPILDITNARKNTRIHYSYAKNTVAELKNVVSKDAYKIGFGMRAISLEELKAIADAQLQMPPKSTYIHPKLPSGLLLYEF